jgi:uncharacterized Zn finger protein
VSRFRSFGPYVSAAERRALAARELARLQKLTGGSVSPVTLEGRAIASTFWGQAWCTNLERYSDFASRLPRGRSYVRGGAVVDLQIAPGEITARVAGGMLYQVRVRIAPLAPARWGALQKACTGRIASLVGLLRGELSAEVLEELTRPRSGLFPEPHEIRLDCSCPDAASLCKHIAATLYGVGARLDARPELFFTLRQVDQAALVSAATVLPPRAAAPAGKRIARDKLSALFGIELDGAHPGGRRKRR